MGLGRVMPETFGREAVEAQGRRNEPLRSTNAGYLGGFAGDVAAGIPMGGGAVGTGVKALRSLGKAAGPIVRGIAEGSTVGAAMSKPGERTAGAQGGAVLGGAVPAAGAALSRVGDPLRAIPEAKNLVGRNVDLTAGQINPDSYIGQLERALQSVGLFGRKLGAQRQKPVGQFYREVASEAGPPGFLAKDGTKDDLVQQLRDAYGLTYDDAIKAYTKLEPVIKNAAADVPLVPRQVRPGQPKVAGALDDTTRGGYPGTFMTNQDRARSRQNISNQISEVDPFTTSGAELQALRSNLRTSGREGQTAGERAIARRAAGKVTESIESQIAPDDAAKLRAADARYPGKLAFEDAASASRDRPWPTSYQLSNAVKGVSDEGDYAVGKGPLRDLARAGTKVFQDAPETGARAVTAGKFPGTKAAVLTGVNMIPSKVLAGLTAPQKKVANFLISMKGFDEAYPIIASMARTSPVVASQAGE
jgi:hypothetical protein